MKNLVKSHLVLLSILIIVFLGPKFLGNGDYLAFWASSLAVKNGVNPYDGDAVYALLLRETKLNYFPETVWALPFVHSLLWTFSLWSYDDFVRYWQIFAILMMFYGTYFSFRALTRASESLNFKFDSPVPFVAVSCLYFPLWVGVLYDPLAPIVYLGFCLFLYFLSHEKSDYSDILAGLFLSLTAVKPHLLHLLYAVIFFRSVQTRKWNLFVGIMLGLVILTVGSFSIQPQLWVDYVRGLGEFPLRYMTPTVGSWGVRILKLSDPRWLFLPTLIVQCCIAVFIFRSWYDKRSAPITQREILLFVVPISVVSAPYLWGYDFSLLLPTILLLLINSTKETRPFFYAVVLAAEALLFLATPKMHYWIWFPWFVAFLIFIAWLQKERDQQVE
ncbi:MAG: hypothetical protein KDD55_05255 [Bdellovibrionales bacterium]|nr:hypothetical protein [Bdellovibrionales bacterium]